MKFILISLLISYNAVSFTTDFRNFLNEGYPEIDLSLPSYGGRLGPNEVIGKEVFIFIHGNSDMAISKLFPNKTKNWGWNNHISYLLNRKINTNQLYAFTYGNMNPDLAYLNNHKSTYVNQIYKFIDAVKKYSEASKINIIAHSLGVTLTRKALMDYEIKYVDIFVGIAGANMGLESCVLSIELPTCSIFDGLHPNSYLLYELNKQKRFAREIISVCSEDDELLNAKLSFFDYNTCFIPNSDSHVILKGLSHFDSKNKSMKEIYDLLRIN